MRGLRTCRFVAGFVVLLASSMLVGCNGGQPDELYARSTAVPQHNDNTPSSKDKAEQVIGALMEGTKSYSSFEEAEQVAGYHIPRPSRDYPVAFDLTYLRWFPEGERPLSETHYTYPPIAPNGFVVTVKPSYMYPKGDKTATSGKPTTVGGKAGWLDDEDIAWVFVFECGFVDDVKVWCQVDAVKEIGWEAFDHFVSTLQ